MHRHPARNLVALILLSSFVITTSAWATPPDTAAGTSVFRSKCASCHGTDGAGTAAGRSLNVADLRSPAVQNQSNAQLEQIVKNGQNNMPAFSGNLTDQQIAEVVSHVRTFKKKAGTSTR